MKINYKVNTLNLNDDMSELFCEIDSKIVNISRRKLNTLRYGLRDEDSFKVNYNKVKILSYYKDILIKKLNKSSCFKAYELETIIKKIKKLLNTN